MLERLLNIHIDRSKSQITVKRRDGKRVGTKPDPVQVVRDIFFSDVTVQEFP